MAEKKENLTPEQRLQEALVPCTEWPYKLPENWCWTYLGIVCNFENGYAFKSKQFSQAYGIPVVRISDIRNNRIDLTDCIYTTEDNIPDKFIIKNGDLLIAMSGATTGKNGVFYSNKIAYLNQRVGNIKVTFESVLIPMYRNYFIQRMQQEILDSAYGGAQPNISSSKICSMYFPLSPFNEQQRIVDRIENLFSRLDEAKEKAQAALDSFESRKAAILHKAFTGELTAKWRSEHGVGMDSWKNSSLGQYAHSQYGYTESASESPIGPKFLRITDIQNGLVDWNSVPYCSIGDSDFEKYRIKKDDIVVARTGATTGKSYLIQDEVDAVFASYLIRLTIYSDELSSPYLYRFMQSPDYWGQIMELSSGIAQPGVNAKKLKVLALPIPSYPEQQEIVRMLDSLLAKEQQAKEAAETVLEQIELIKKSILSRAFRGELGTNDPNEESSVELLKEILSQSKEKVQRKKSTFVPDELQKRLETELEKQIIKQFLQNPGEDLSLDHLMSVSSKKFDIIQTIRNLKNRGIIENINEKYRLRT